MKTIQDPEVFRRRSMNFGALKRIMKKCVQILITFGAMILLGSCIFPDPLGPPVESWLCSINADGTGFRKIKKAPFYTPGLVDIYMTKDNRIIFYGEKLWISDPDDIHPISITDNIYRLQENPARLSQSPDGSKLYFASRDKNIHELDLNTLLSRQLTDERVRTLRNPIVSDLGNYITYSSRGYGQPYYFSEYMYWHNLITGESAIIPSPDTVAVNPSYSEIEDYVYYEKRGLFRSRLDGSDRSTVDDQGGSASPYTMFSISRDHRYIVHNSNPSSTYFIRIFDKVNESGIDIPVKDYGASELMGVMCNDINRIYYVSPGYPEKLWVRDLDSSESKILKPNNIEILGIYMIAPTWDGSKVYFYAEIAEK